MAGGEPRIMDGHDARNAPPAWRERAATLAGDVRTWILVFALIRCVGLTDPPMEVGHAWRQSLTNMIARNMVEVDPSPLYPRADHFGDGSGIIGAEFPLLNGLIALMMALLGPAQWYGRLIVLLASCIGTWYFFKLVEGLFTRRIAFFATLSLLASLWFEFSRKIMPDVFSVSLVIIALYQAMRYLMDGRAARLVAFAVLATAGGLSKLPALCLCAALLVPLLSERPGLKRRRALALASLPVLVLVGLWYFRWVPHLIDTWHNPLYFPRDPLRGARELWASRGLTAEMFYFQAFRSFMAFAAALFGLIVLFRAHRGPVLTAAGLIAGVFLVFMVKAGEVFSNHGYYMVPFVPVMAVLCALAVDRLPGRWSTFLIAAICVEGVANQSYDLVIPEKRRYLYGVEAIADRFTARHDLVIVNGERDPQWMYYLHRKGWSLSNAHCDDRRLLDSLVRRGATCLFKFGKELKNPAALRVLHADEHMLVLDPRREP